jgi:hypothetical protein
VRCSGNDREKLVKEGGERMGHVHLSDECSARAPVCTRCLIGYRFGDVSERGRR